MLTALDGDASQRQPHQVSDALRLAGLKATPQRLQIFREVATTTDHPDAATVWRGVRVAMPTVSLDTVYRTLWLLIDLGLLTTLGPPRDRARFDANVTPHHHFVCTRCGLATDFPARVFDRLETPEAASTLGRVDSTHVELRGVCARCLETADARKSRSALGAGL